MSTEIKSWHIVAGQLKKINCSLAENGNKEKDHLDQWVKPNPSVHGGDIALIGEQVQTNSLLSCV
jgi:hypothetical protein